MKITPPLIVRHPRTAWGVLLALCALVAVAAGLLDERLRSAQNIGRLAHDAERMALEIMGETANGKLMGLTSLLGLTNDEVKFDVATTVQSDSLPVLSVLESIGRTYDADGVFLVGRSGVVKSSWDNAGKPSTGLDVAFRPYFQMGMQGSESIYAAVSLARGERSLYFSSPIYKGNSQDSDIVGVAVARTSMSKIDGILKSTPDGALLVSPHGMVFASSRTEWLGRMVFRPSPEQLKTIRDQRQFGSFIEGKYPDPLPFKLTPEPQLLDAHRIVVASAPLSWNDPFGDWRLVLVGNLSRTRSQLELLGVAGGAFALSLVLGLMSFTLWRGRYRQAVTSNELQAYADAQSASNALKSQLAAAGLLLQRAPDMAALASAFLAESRSLFGALQGVVYVRNFQDETTMNRVGMAACAHECPETLKCGEGLLGQCAADGQMRVVDAGQEPGWVLRSGLGEAPPAALMLLPVVLQGTLIGAVELGLQALPDEMAQAHCLEWAQMLAINLEVQRRKLNTEATLAEKLKEEQATQSQIAFQQALIDAIPYPMFYKGPDTRFRGFNRAYEETFGVKRNDLIGKSVLDLEYLPEASRKAYQAEDELAVATAGTVRRIAQIPYADGVLRETLYSVVGFRSADGKPGGLVGTFIDLSALSAQIDKGDIPGEAT